MEAVAGGGGGGGGESVGELLLRAAAMVPAEHYALAALAVVSVLAYGFLELHFLGDLLRGFRGGRVELTFHPASEIYHRVASKCRSLHGRFVWPSHVSIGSCDDNSYSHRLQFCGWKQQHCLLGLLNNGSGYFRCAYLDVNDGFVVS